MNKKGMCHSDGPYDDINCCCLKFCPRATLSDPIPWKMGNLMMNCTEKLQLKGVPFFQSGDYSESNKADCP